MSRERPGARATVTPRPPEWGDPPGYDRKLGRIRTPSDDFYDHRLLVLQRIRQSLATSRK
jgi:hypothetical protein